MKKTIYAVKNGRKTGIFNEWSKCAEQTDKYPNAKYRSFAYRSEFEGEPEDVPGSLRHAMKEAAEYLGNLVYLGESANYLEDADWEKYGFLPFGAGSKADGPGLFSDQIEGDGEDKGEYFTWKGLDSWKHRTYDDAIKDANRKGLKGVFPARFKYEKEAEAFCKGELDQYILDKCKPFEMSQYDAVIYTDGSCGKDNKIVAYGLIIFFGGKAEPHIESGTVEDVDTVKYKIIRYDERGNERKDGDIIKEIASDNKDVIKTEGKGFVSKSRSITAEFSGIMRALEICCHEEGAKKLLVIYDCEDVQTEYDNRDMPGKDDGYAASEYRKLLRNLKDTDLQFIKIDSHRPYPIDADEYPHAVYNDLVDILARAELGIKIDPKDNPNVFRAISDDFERFSDIGAVGREAQRQHARKLVNAVLNKSNGIFHPKF